MSGESALPDLDLFHELTGIIRTAIDDHPRSAQRQLGPSEIGCPCDRKLGHRRAGTVPVNAQSGRWRPHVGTCLHVVTGDQIQATNPDGGLPRWLVETKVEIDRIADDPLNGTIDLIDLRTMTVIDLKFVGTTTLRKVRAGEVSQQYRVQVHTYAKGVAAQGLPIARVALLFLPTAGELSEAVWWSEPYDQAIADEAIDRANAIATLVDGAGPAALALLRTAPAYCTSCPYFLPAATDLTEACPGHPPERAPAA